MEVYKLSFLIALLGGVIQLTLAQTRDCSGTCISNVRCSPYFKDLVWTVVNGACRVYQNGCIFGNENCSRANQCLPPLVATSQAKCKEFCQRLCPRAGVQVCGWFPYSDSAGRYMSFPNCCLLDQYACQNSQAYVGEPILGPCPLHTMAI
ncbi:salivary glue protein Sgs-5 isoform X1 [Drosophila persimilis]|uniref:salivary glue protein Sgs-5 isoform X1 n=1 Tax=Drosophila persimilis TaxID=7234 RepID=UPI000F07457D|nr:salivary glue protein Sgs-5 isoform X1 [Drosophila persimilis]XP_026849652.1 salivary glue protein Sgs-5 isoform X1 [Drosophila persimilis]